MAVFDLNSDPVDDEEEVLLEQGLNSEKPKTEIDYNILPIKKRILMFWNKKDEQETKLDDVCDDALNRKRQRVESDPKTPPIAESSVQKRQKSKSTVSVNSKARLSKKSGIKPKTMLVGQSSGNSIDAVQLLPDYVKNNPEFQDRSEVKLVIQKTITEADIDNHQDRLSIPYKKIIKKFVTDSEYNLLKTRIPDCGNKKYVLQVKVIGPCSDKIYKMSLRRWDYKGNGFRFAIASGWKHFIKENKLKKDDFIQVVSFRVKDRLCFVILKPDDDVSSSPSMARWGLKRKRTHRVGL